MDLPIEQSKDAAILELSKSNVSAFLCTICAELTVVYYPDEPVPAVVEVSYGRCITGEHDKQGNATGNISGRALRHMIEGINDSTRHYFLNEDPEEDHTEFYNFICVDYAYDGYDPDIAQPTIEAKRMMKVQYFINVVPSKEDMYPIDKDKQLDSLKALPEDRYFRTMTITPYHSSNPPLVKDPILYPALSGEVPY